MLSNLAASINNAIVKLVYLQAHQVELIHALCVCFRSPQIGNLDRLHSRAA
jgi:hypothetical protein